MADVLAATVHVHVDEHGEPGRFVFEAGTVPPEWAVPLITNPDAWADSSGSEAEPGSEPVDTPDGGVDGPPPRTGQGSSRAAWAEYAESVGVDIDDDMSRDDIIDAIDDRG